MQHDIRFQVESEHYPADDDYDCLYNQHEYLREGSAFTTARDHQSHDPEDHETHREHQDPDLVRLHLLGERACFTRYFSSADVFAVGGAAWVPLDVLATINGVEVHMRLHGGVALGERGKNLHHSIRVVDGVLGHVGELPPALVHREYPE